MVLSRLTNTVSSTAYHSSGTFHICQRIPYPVSRFRTPDRIPVTFNELKMLCRVDKHGFKTGSVGKHIKIYRLNRGSTFITACLQTNDYCLPRLGETCLGFGSPSAQSRSKTGAKSHLFEFSPRARCESYRTRFLAVTLSVRALHSVQI